MSNECMSVSMWKLQDLLDDLQAVIDEEPDIYPNWRRVTLCEARDYLKEFFQSREWISVKDRLPEYGKSVLVTNGSCWCSVWCLYRRDHEGNCWEDDYGYWQDFEDVTHWMPLPNPPKED